MRAEISFDGLSPQYQGEIVKVSPAAVISFIACFFEGETASIYMTNNSLYDVVGVYYADPGTNAWSENLLDGPISPGKTRVIGGIPREILDIKIVFGDPDSTTNITVGDFTVVSRINMTVSF